MIKIIIGEAEREISNADEGWINQQINRRRADGISVCVKVIIKENDVDMILMTSTCKTRSGGGRLPRPREKRIFELWDKRRLNEESFTGGNLIAFLRQLYDIL